MHWMFALIVVAAVSSSVAPVVADRRPVVPVRSRLTGIAVEKFTVEGDKAYVLVRVGKDTAGFAVYATSGGGGKYDLSPDPDRTGPVAKGGLANLEIDLGPLPAGTYDLKVWGCSTRPPRDKPRPSCNLGPPGEGTFTKP